MADYYFISQLPSLDAVSENAPLPITEERFLELCSRFLGKRAQSEIEKLSTVPPLNPEKSYSALIEAFNSGERDLRLALSKIRAEKMKKALDLENKNLPAELVKVAGAALEIQNPLEAEKFLCDYRLKFLETLRPMDTFSEDYVFYYLLRLKLIMRIRKFDTQAGEEAYRNIYNSILNGDRLEVVQ